MSEILAIVAISAAATGAVVSTVQGYWKHDKPYSPKRLLSALISSVFVGFGLVNIVGLPEQLSTLGWTGLVLGQLLLGYGIDQGLSELDK